MSKKSNRKKRKTHSKTNNTFSDGIMWQDDQEEVHNLMPDLSSSPEKLY